MPRGKRTTEFSAALVKAIAREIEAAVKPLAKKHGVAIAYRGGSYNVTSATLKLEVAAVAKNGVIETRERQEYKQYAEMFGLPQNKLDATISYLGDKYKVIGLKMRSSKFPVLAERQPDGRRFKLPVSAITSR